MKDAVKMQEMRDYLGVPYHYESDSSTLIKVVYAIFVRLCKKGVL